MARNVSEEGLEPRTPLSTQVSSRHHAMLDALYREGLMKVSVIEKGIEMFYAKMADAGFVDGLLLQDEDAEPDVA